MLCIVTQYTLPDALGRNALLMCMLVSVQVGVGVCPSVQYIRLNTSFIFRSIIFAAENGKVTKEFFVEEVNLFHIFFYNLFFDLIVW